jgi:hypothetical protein
MAITNLATLLAAKRELISFQYTASRGSFASQYASQMGLAFNGTTGTIAGTSTTTGVVPDDTTAGALPIESFNGTTGYIADVDVQSNIQTKIILVDMLWKAGAYAFNASTTGQTPTSYASRIPGGDYKGTEIWYEAVTSGTGAQNVNVTYINQDGVAGRSTGTVAFPTTAAIGRMHRLPLQSGDTGVQGVTGVVGSVATAGTFNILVLRPLVAVTTDAAPTNSGAFIGLNKVLMPQIFDTSALQILTLNTTANTPIFNVDIGVISG